MTDQSIQEHVKALIEAQVIQALNSAPDAIEKMVKAAFAKPVDPDNGRSDGYASNRVPYLDWLVGHEIREAAERSVGRIMREKQDEIDAIVRARLSSDEIASQVVKAFIGPVNEDWRINVKFDAEKSR